MILIPKSAVLLLAFCMANGEANGTEKSELQNQDSDIETWEPPAEMSRDCPYYHAGYDYGGRPVLVIEFGKWNSWKYTDEKVFPMYEKYAEKTWWRIAQLKPLDPEAEQGVIVIMDLRNLDNRQLTSPKLVGFFLKFAIKSAIAEPHIAEMLVINYSFAGSSLFNVFRVGAGRLAGRTEIFGTMEQKWRAVLRSKIPADQLPPWYGGKDDFKPVQIFG